MTQDDARQAHLEWWMRENVELVTPENREVLTAAIDSAFGAGVLFGSERMMAKVSDAEIEEFFFEEDGVGSYVIGPDTLEEMLRKRGGRNA